jgi:hypothetical protein
MRENVDVQTAPDGTPLVPQPHGGALRAGGPGRPKSQASIAIREARYQLKASLDALVKIRDGGKCKHCGRGASTPDEITRAAIGIMRLSGIDKEKPAKRKRTTFSVVARSAAELAQTTTTPIEPESLPQT